MTWMCSELSLEAAELGFRTSELTCYSEVATCSGFHMRRGGESEEEAAP